MGSRKLRFPDFVTMAQDSGRLSGLRTGRLYLLNIMCDIFTENFITRTILGEQYKSFSSSLCNLLHSPVTSSLLGPNILLNTMCDIFTENTNVEDKSTHPLEIRPNIIHPSTPRSPQWSPSLRFPHREPIHPPLLYHTRNMNITQYNTTQYNTIQHNTIQYNTTQHNKIQYSTIQHNTTQHNKIQYNTTRHDTIKYNTIQYNTIK